METKYFKVGQAAEMSGTTRKAIRIYEARGLLPVPQRTEAGYRLFTAADVETLAFIRRARALGLTIAEVGDVLDLQRGGAQPCGHVIDVLDAHLAQVEKTLEELRQLRDTLQSAREAADEIRCIGSDALVCRIIESALPESRTMLRLNPKSTIGRPGNVGVRT